MSNKSHINDDDEAVSITSDKPNQYEIRPMDETDLSIVVEIEKMVWGDAAWDLSDFDQYLNGSLSSCWILENTNSAQPIVGYGLQSLPDNKSLGVARGSQHWGGVTKFFEFLRRVALSLVKNLRRFVAFLQQKIEIFEDWRGVTPPTSPRSRHRCESHITNLTLHPSQWGRGLGGLLLRHMIKHARLTCAVRMSLGVNTSNERAYKLYFNHGFRISKLLPKYYSGGFDAYCMILQLKNEI
ncbi:unnamed protein product [Adineta steineri]|uniref:N-acetyltransferase domain-containing protein n=1 Tax=Adineta steineri TaxID=433720 RepID=A0A818L626_9BILA|nr:unnamed protein product [Adineta steineri]CAF3561502.1 unnamed protein product [Adineta steineri]